MSLLIYSDRLTRGYDNPFIKLTEKNQDLTNGLSFPGLKFCIIGTKRKVKAWYYEGKPDFYKNRRATNYVTENTELLTQYQKRLNITILGFIAT